MSDHRWPMLLFFLFLCYGAAGLGSIWTSSSVGTRYAELMKPSFNPPSWIFAPVWSVLYFLMALSAWFGEGPGGAAQDLPWHCSSSNWR